MAGTARTAPTTVQAPSAIYAVGAVNGKVGKGAGILLRTIVVIFRLVLIGVPIAIGMWIWRIIDALTSGQQPKQTAETDADRLASATAGLSGREGSASAFDLQAASVGMALIWLQARASDPQLQPGWVNRRVEQLEFLDTRAVRWKVSIDFIVPEGAPSVRLGNETFHLVPVTSLAKANLVAFNLRDEESAAVWMPTSQQTTHYLVSALVHWASQDLGIAPQEVPSALVTDLEQILTADPLGFRSRPPALLAAAALIDANRSYRRAARTFTAVRLQLEGTGLRQIRRRRGLAREVDRAGRELAGAGLIRQEVTQKWAGVAEDVRPFAYRLMASANFRSRIEELGQNFVVHVGAKTPPGTRRIVKLAYESEVRFARPRGRFRRLWQSLGWRCWQVDVLIGGRGGSHHLEVTAPPGVDVVGITADPLEAEKAAGEIRWWRRLVARVRPFATRTWWHRLIFWDPIAAISVFGYSPHVHINPRDGACIRYRAAIFVRVSRPGWLTASWLVAIVIAAVIGFGRLNLPAVYVKGATGEAGTAATLLLALLGVFATMLVRPGEHPLASRLLLLARFLILIDAAAVLVGVGYLVLHHVQHPVPVTVWTWLAIVSGAVAILFTISWLLPVARRPHRE